MLIISQKLIIQHWNTTNLFTLQGLRVESLTPSRVILGELGQEKLKEGSPCELKEISAQRVSMYGENKEITLRPYSTSF